MTVRTCAQTACVDVRSYLLYGMPEGLDDAQAHPLHPCVRFHMVNGKKGNKMYHTLPAEIVYIGFLFPIFLL